MVDDGDDVTRAGAPMPQVGEAVRGRFTKWGDRPHWVWDGTYLGADEHGHWWFAPAGTLCERPGVAFESRSPWVSLTPHDGAWVAGFYPHDHHITVYVDMTTQARWQRRDVADDARDVDGGGDGPEWEVTMVDLDLDVVLTDEGRLYVDDEDEFAQHQVELGYPPEVVAMAERASREVLAAVESGQEPFGTVGHRRLAEAAAEHDRRTRADGVDAAGPSTGPGGRRASGVGPGR